jgi:hypothetical protein
MSAAGSAIANIAPLNDGHIETALGQVVSGGDSGKSRSNYYGCWFAHKFLLLPFSFSIIVTAQPWRE